MINEVKISGTSVTFGKSDFIIDFDKLKEDLEKSAGFYTDIFGDDRNIKDLMEMIGNGRRGKDIFRTPMELYKVKAVASAA